MSERQEKWDRRYLKLAQEVATWSKDPSTKVGAVLVRPSNSVASTGFNGFAPGADDSPELYADREYKYKHVIHAEANALNFLEQTAEGFTLYTSFPCCPICMRTACEAGVSRVVSVPLDKEGRDFDWVLEWEERLAASARIAELHGVVWEFVDV